MKIGLQLSFTKESLNGKYYFELFEKFVKFQPYSFRHNYITKPWDSKKHLKIIKELSYNDSIGISGNEEALFSVNITKTKTPQISIYITQNQELFYPNNESIVELIQKNSFIVAYLFDEEYTYVQSTRFSNNFESKNLNLSSITNTPFIINEFGYKEYDITKNPGRMDLNEHYWMIPAWKMWYSNDFFTFISKEKILSFPDAYEIRELNNGIIFVQLFEKVEESATKINMEKQQKWRDWIV